MIDCDSLKSAVIFNGKRIVAIEDYSKDPRATLTPIRGYETEPMCRNCRHFNHSEGYQHSIGACKKKTTGYLTSKANYVYPHPNDKCDDFKSWDYYTRDNGINKSKHAYDKVWGAK